MSAYKKINCSFKDQKTLIQALNHLGFEPVIHSERQNLKGFENTYRQEQAEIIVPRAQISRASNDLGFSFEEKNKEYIMICSEYDLHLGLGDKVKQSYALTAIKAALQKNKFTIKEETNENKKIKIVAGKII
jgi:predicted sugar kinase